MSFEALSWAIKQELKAPEKSVLLMLAYRDNPDPPHGCFPSIPRIAKDCGLSERTVQRCLDRLEAVGLIKRGLRSHRSTLYSIPYAWVVSQSHHPGVRQSPPLVSHSHPEPKVLTQKERKPRAQTRSARDRFDDEIERQRRIEAQQRREAQDAAVRRELMVG